jgi:purine-nucleoside phosphorylase
MQAGPQRQPPEFMKKSTPPPPASAGASKPAPAGPARRSTGAPPPAPGAARGSMTPEATADLLRILSPLRPALGIVLGSGFHNLESEMRVAKEVAYTKLPGFPATAIRGHRGKLLLGHLGPTPVIVLGGRSHYYEGHDFAKVTFAVRTLAAFGVTDLLLTNAAGGINPAFRPGDFMVVTDHINMMGANPLRGEAPPNRPRFVDLTRAYDPGLSDFIRKAALECSVSLHSGVYLAVSGPSYETPAEVRAFARLGADAVGMSTVPEVIAARQHGLCVAAVSCITNLAAGMTPRPLSHEEVLLTAERVKVSGTFLLKHFARLYGQAHAL